MPVKCWTKTSLIDPKILATEKSIQNFHLELPSITKTTSKEWKFEDENILLKKGWSLYRDQDQSIFYVMNTVVMINSVPRGCLLMDIMYDNQDRSTIIMADVVDIKRPQFVVYGYFIPNTIPLYCWLSLDTYNQVNFHIIISPDTNDKSLKQQIKSQWTSYSMYLLKNIGFYWKGTSEYLCVPTTENVFTTLEKCKEKIYPQIKNRNTWVENGNDPLYNYMNWWNRLSADKKVESLKFE